MSTTASNAESLPTINTKGAATREQILRAAVSAFSQRGYRAASLREIAAEVGLSHAGILHHYPTKEVLVQAVLDLRDAEDLAEIEADAAAGVNPFQSVLRLVERNALRRSEVGLFVMLSAEATAPEHPAYRHIKDRYHRLVDRATGMFQDAQKAGQLRPGIDPVSAARSLVALVDGLQIQWLLWLDDDGPHVDMVHEVRTWLGMLLTEVPS